MAGFLMGVIRNLILIPRFGEETSMLLEVPIMLFVSWKTSRRIVLNMVNCIKNRGTQSNHSQLGMLIFGFVSYLELQIYEILIAKLLTGQTTMEFIKHQFIYPNTIGHFAQVLFGCFPTIQYIIIMN